MGQCNQVEREKRPGYLFRSPFSPAKICRVDWFFSTHWDRSRPADSLPPVLLSSYSDSTSPLCLFGSRDGSSFLMLLHGPLFISFSFFSGFYEVRRKVQPQGQVGFEAGDSEQFRALVEESGLLLFPHMCLPLLCPLHWKEPVGLFSAAHILMTWLTRAFQKKM